MSLQRKSKWQRHPKPIRERGASEERRKSWAELFGQLKPKKKKTEPISVRDQVRKRDGGMCQHPGCNKRATSRHHILFRSQAPSRKGDVENQVSLCDNHHTLSNDCPHRSDYWRRYWENWSKERYPAYWQSEKRRERA